MNNTVTQPSAGSGAGPVSGGGWRIVRSVPLELDVALGIVSGRQLPTALPRALTDLEAAVPAVWIEDWERFLGPRRPYPGVLVLLADLAGTIDKRDYAEATLPMRELTPKGALRAANEVLDALDQADTRAFETVAVEPYGGRDQAQPEGSPAAIDAALRRSLTKVVERLIEHHGFDLNAATALARRAEVDIEALPRLLRGGDLSTEFWMWLDRFYYQVYAPWRTERESVIADAEARAKAALGSATGSEPPPISWLSPQNALRRIGPIRDRVASGQIEVAFWLEPFGLFDLAHLRPAEIMISFSPPGELLESFDETVDSLAARLKALADPTRLKILRLVRNYEMDNTDLAAYLELSRPTVSTHAKQLRDLGLVTSRKEGRSVFHAVVTESVRELEDDLRRFLDLPADGRSGE